MTFLSTIFGPRGWGSTAPHNADRPSFTSEDVKALAALIQDKLQIARPTTEDLSNAVTGSRDLVKRLGSPLDDHDSHFACFARSDEGLRILQALDSGGLAVFHDTLYKATRGLIDPLTSAQSAIESLLGMPEYSLQPSKRESRSTASSHWSSIHSAVTDKNPISSTTPSRQIQAEDTSPFAGAQSKIADALLRATYVLDAAEAIMEANDASTGDSEIDSKTHGEKILSQVRSRYLNVEKLV